MAGFSANSSGHPAFGSRAKTFRLKDGEILTRVSLSQLKTKLLLKRHEARHTEDYSCPQTGLPDGKFSNPKSQYG
jgi:hypothetical protein